MSRTHQLAKLLVCSWALGGDRDEDLPTANGVLDRALEIARQKEVFPEWVWDELHFADSRVGLQCVELPGVLSWAQTAELTVAPHPFHRVTRVKISVSLARRLLDGLSIPSERAAEWGRVLREAARQAADEYAAVR